MYQTILFDLDGTLTDPGVGITNSVAYALEKWGIHVEDKTELFKFIGPPLTESFEKYYHFSAEDAKQAVVYYREYFSEKGIWENVVYDGTEALLRSICDSGRRILLATSKPEKFAIQILEHFGLAKYFTLIAGASLDGTRCAKANVISYALQRAQIQDLRTAVMIGDREHDILGAKQVGIDSIGVLFGYGNREELQAAGADYIAANTDEIYSFLD